MPGNNVNHSGPPSPEAVLLVGCALALFGLVRLGTESTALSAIADVIKAIAMVIVAIGLQGRTSGRRPAN